MSKPAPAVVPLVPIDVARSAPWMQEEESALSFEEVRDALGDDFSQSIVQVDHVELTGMHPRSGAVQGGTVVTLMGSNLKTFHSPSNTFMNSSAIQPLCRFGQAVVPAHTPLARAASP